MPWKSTYCFGFSVLEVIIGLSLCALLLALGVPSLSRLQGESVLLGAAQQIASVIRLARIEALEAAVQTRIIFDVVGNRFLFRGKDGKTRIYPVPGGIALYATNFPSNELRFLPSGTPLCGGTVILRTPKKRKYIIIAPVTGRVRLSDTSPQ
ncbi:GspH/FimT family pseudopilin [Candidatus Caldatribacterium saccharofermentans]|uniref:Type II secretion system protein H n=1 Tax=Candidatus Caldatribacterium saccharofermentans TaxID=1454753 RepID=A0A7V4WJC8_9BACT